MDGRGSRLGTGRRWKSVRLFRRTRGRPVGIFSGFRICDRDRGPRSGAVATRTRTGGHPNPASCNARTRYADGHRPTCSHHDHQGPWRCNFTDDCDDDCSLAHHDRDHSSCPGTGPRSTTFLRLMSWWMFRAMGTTVHVMADAQSIASDVQDIFEHVEDVASRFRSDSELSRLNRKPAGTHQVSEVLAALLSTACDLRTRTAGRVDAGIGQRVVDWGYDRPFNVVSERPGGQEPDPVVAAARWSVGSDTVEKSAGITFDLGGIAKGWTVDRALEASDASAVSAGGDMRTRNRSHMVAIDHPLGGQAATIVLNKAALATSSTQKRRWRIGSTDAHHIIDPRTGNPCESPVLSATAVTRTAVEAEAAAKSIVLRGEFGLEWADAQPWVQSALAVWHDGAVYGTTGLELADA